MEKLDNLYKRLVDNNEYFIGYPCNYKYDYSDLYKFLDFSINNVGDPFDKSTRYKMNSKEIEREVIKYFMDLYNANLVNHWGYITNGGTEGNMYGLYAARDRFKHKGTIVYYSNQSHYSIEKILRVLNIPGIKIPTDSKGEINYDVLNGLLKARKKDHPVIICANLGTTMTGAIDNIKLLKFMCEKYKLKHHIHADAALSGMMLPFLEEAQPHKFDDGIDSIAVSGHKFIGTPIPCGIVLTKQDYSTGNEVEYVKTIDSTLMGSRDGFSPLMLYHNIELNKDKFKYQVQRCLYLADHLIYKFSKIGINAWRNHNSNTVVFPIKGIPEHILDKWHIATEGLNGHILVMQHVSKKKIKEFIKDIS